MGYKECKFYIEFDRCNHKDAPEPYHSLCIGKEECTTWDDPATCRGIDINSPIYRAAPELYEELKSLWQGVKFHHLADPGKIFSMRAEQIEKALAKAEGRS